MMNASLNLLSCLNACGSRRLPKMDMVAKQTKSSLHLKLTDASFSRRQCPNALTRFFAQTCLYFFFYFVPINSQPKYGQKHAIQRYNTTNNMYIYIFNNNVIKHIAHGRDVSEAQAALHQHNHAFVCGFSAAHFMYYVLV